MGRNRNMKFFLMSCCKLPLLPLYMFGEWGANSRTRIEKDDVKRKL